ncbi:MAG: M23 family metallopeptidase [Alphaproteobacteria bacterium]|nr:M23 family metallopeptidase [Alphaproteobacteria bacterium]
MIRSRLSALCRALALLSLLGACASQPAAPLRLGAGNGTAVQLLGPTAPPAPSAATVVPGPPPPPAALAPTGDSYIVQPGDGLFTLGRRLGIAPARLIAANRLEKPYKLRTGQRLLLPKGDELQASRLAALAPAADQAASGAARGQTATVQATSRPVPSLLRAEPATEASQLVAQSIPAAASPTASQPAALPIVEVPVLPAESLVEAPARQPETKPATASAAVVESPAMPRGSGRFLWPASGELLSRFGPKPGGLYNDGINIKVNPGQAVRAAEAGAVAYAGNELKGFGNLLLIRHADGWVSAYAHNQSLLVKAGGRVQRGQTIALAGDSGNVGTPQLHFELRRGSVPVDPLPHLGEEPPTRSVLRAARPGPG